MVGWSKDTILWNTTAKANLSKNKIFKLLKLSLTKNFLTLIWPTTIKAKEKATQTLKYSKPITTKELHFLKTINTLSILPKQKPDLITLKAINQSMEVPWRIQKPMMRKSCILLSATFFLIPQKLSMKWSIGNRNMEEWKWKKKIQIQPGRKVLKNLTNMPLLTPNQSKA